MYVFDVETYRDSNNYFVPYAVGFANTKYL